MRVLLGTVAIILLMAIGGWLIFTFDDNRMTVEFDKEKASQDTTQAVNKAGEALGQATSAIKNVTSSASTDEIVDEPEDKPQS